MKRLSILFSSLFLSNVLIVSSSIAETKAIGFGWDSATSQEKIYSVELSDGSVTETGTIDGLQSLSLGSYDFSSSTRASVVLGYPSVGGTGSVFLIDPITMTSFQFELPEIENVTFQDVLLNPKDGFVYALAFNRLQGTNEIYKVTLIPGSTIGEPAKAVPALITSLSIEGYSVGSIAIGGDNVMRILLSSHEILSVDLATLESSRLPTSITPQSMFSCKSKGTDVPSLFLISYSGSQNHFFSLDTSGIATEIGATSSIYGWDPGSQTCSQKSLFLLGVMTQNGPDVYYTLAREGGEVETKTLSSDNLKIVYQYDVPSSDDGPGSPRLRKNILKIGATTLGKCGKKISILRKAKSFRKIVSATRKINFSKRRCSLK